MNLSDINCREEIFLAALAILVAVTAVFLKLLAYYGRMDHLHDRVVKDCINQRYDRAFSLLEKKLARQPSSYALCNEMGYALILANRPQEAKPWLLKATRLDPREITPYVNLSWACLKLNEYKEAIEYSEKVLSLYPRDVDSFIHKGTSCLSLGQYQEAFSCFSRALKLAPDSSRSLFGYGAACFHLDRTDEAMAALKKYIQIIPNNSAAYEYLARCFRRKGDTVQEMQACRMILLIDDTIPRIYYYLGECAYALDDFEHSLEHLDRAVQLDPLYADALYLKSRVLCRLRRNEEALGALRSAVDADASLRYKALDDPALDGIKVFHGFRALFPAGGAMR